MNPVCSAQLRDYGEMIAFYLLAILDDGDYLNDWLTHIPECGVGAIQGIGMMLAFVLGYAT